MQVLLKSSKQKAFENVRINSITLLFLKMQEKVALQTPAKGESLYFKDLLTSPSCLRFSFSSAGCLTSSPCLKTLRDDLGPRPQATYNWGVSSLAKSAICVEKKCQNTIHGTRKLNKHKPTSIYHTTALRMFFQTPKAVEMPGDVPAAALKEC